MEHTQEIQNLCMCVFLKKDIFGEVRMCECDVRDKHASVNAEYLYLLTWHFKAKGLVVVRIQGVLLYCCFLFLQSFPILH